MNKIFTLISRNKYLLMIVVLAAILRFFDISNNPPSLNWDEISHGYNAYSILETGRDEWGMRFPSIFRAYGDYKLPVYIYITAISEALFGINAFAVRVPSVLAGIGSVIFTYLLVFEFGKLDREKSQVINYKQMAIISALLMTVEPWSLFLSRAAFEANLAQFFVIAGVYYFLRNLRHPEFISISKSKGILKRVQNDKFSLILSSVFFGLSVWTYNSARVFVPLLLASMVWIFRKEIRDNWEIEVKSKRTIAYSLFIIAFFFLPMFVQLVNPAGSARYSKVQILDEGTINQINEGRNTSTLSPVMARMVHNKATYFGREFVSNWVSHYSPKYLFFEGGNQYQFSVPDRGILSVVSLPFFYLGLAILLGKLLKLVNGNSKRRRCYWLILGWLLLAPIPSSLTREAPHVLRSITMLPIPMIITAFGFTSFVDWAKGKVKIGSRFTVHGSLSVIYLAILLVSTSFYLREYFTNYRTNYSWSWQYGYKEVVDYASENYDKYDKIIVTKKYGEPHEFFLFYDQWDPAKYRDDPNLNRFAQSDWFWVDGFDKYYLVNDWEIPRGDDALFTTESDIVIKCVSPKGQRIILHEERFNKCLLITSPNNVPDGWNKLETINFLDGDPAFEIYEN